jgi:ABC-type transport system involved in cytochrome bd biosynthesis fused ATPase/permease subunit
MVIANLARVLAGRSALVVTHRPAVTSLAHRVVTLRAGRFVPADDPAFPSRVGNALPSSRVGAGAASP